MTVKELATHLGVRKYRVEVPAGLENPIVFLRLEDRGGSPTDGYFGTALRDMPEPSMLFLVDFSAREGRMAVSFSTREANGRRAVPERTSASTASIQGAPACR